MRILGIETSCDDTSSAVIEAQKEKIKSLSSIVSSQNKLHEIYGGIVPEVASRAHIETIIPAIKESLKRSKSSLKNIDLISVTRGPGLVGSLLIGINTVKTISFVNNLPIVCVNHLEGHIYANFVDQKERIEFPLIVLIVSGGHTMLVYMKDHLKYKILGQTKDDAAGEAFDKVARALGLGYPGGAIIEKISKEGDPEKFKFPKAEMESKIIRLESGYLKKLPPNLDFSFSGLKTAVINEVRKHKTKNKSFIADIVASFQKTSVDILVAKTIWAAERKKVKTVLISGGVAANAILRKELQKKCQIQGFNFFAPPKNLCTDNAAMIAAAGYFKYKNKGPDLLEKIKVNPNLKLGK